MVSQCLPVFKSPLLYLIMALKRKSGDAGDLDMPKRSCKVLPLNGGVKILALKAKKKGCCAEVAKIFSKNDSSIMKL